MATSNPSVSDFVERMGLFWESEGLPRIAGRLFGALLLREHPASLDDLATELGVSKASVSTDTRRLESMGLLVRVSLQGDRRDYYVMGENMPARVLELKLESVRRMERAITHEHVPAVLPDAVRERLARFEATHQQIVTVLESLVADLRPARAASIPPSV